MKLRIIVDGNGIYFVQRKKKWYSRWHDYYTASSFEESLAIFDEAIKNWKENILRKQKEKEFIIIKELKV